ncbi:MAG: UDP-N-acetylmuramoyl-tripeptide--D-alanyl-D-alanine ligase [Proteobacteria bacterium]|nr:UDP-N-acetylmuramoyl-tripeptide--D-alanyl-D-alanine ligase [Pseudomonadota bacterium]
MSCPLWTIDSLVIASGGNLDLPPQKAGGLAGVPPAGRGAGPAGREAAITGFSIDTRSLQPGEVFVALKDARDGHDFVPAAFAAGAVAALVRRDYVRQSGDGALLRVDDPLRALERIGIAARARLSPDARVIAVTGSAGKTGTKEMLRACLRTCASTPERVHAPEKSFNNHWGVPLTLARMPADTEFAVFEIGMNHANEIRPLVKMVRPHIAIVTNVLPVHVGNFPDGETGVANAKAEIFEGFVAPASQRGQPHGSAPGATAILPGDNPHYALLRSKAEAFGARALTFGDTPANDLRLSEAVQGPVAQHIRAAFANSALKAELSYDLGMLGRHLATNSLAVVLALHALGCDPASATRALADVKPAAGRGARAILKSADGEILLLDESYNANPASMAAALGNLAAVADPRFRRRVAVMGDMLELGENAIPYHKGLKPNAERADRVFCCGPSMKHLYDSLPADKKGGYAPTSSELVSVVLDAVRPGDAVMVKGSLGSRMAPIVDAIKKRFAP